MKLKSTTNSRLKKAIAGLACVFTLVGVIFGSGAIKALDPEDDGTELVVTGTYDVDKSQETPLSIETDKEVFYFSGNIDPGDSLHSSIKFTNTSDKYPINVTIAEIRNMLADDKAALQLLGELDLTITLDDGTIIYKGKHGKTTTPVVGIMEVQPNDSIIVHIQVDFPKDADNTYQSAPMHVRYLFESTLDIGDTDWDDEPPSFPEKVKTGLQEGDPATYGMLLITIAAIVLVIIIILFFIKKKKKENKKDEEKSNN